MNASHPLALLVWPLAEPAALAAAAAQVDDWPRLIEEAGHEGLLGLLAARLSDARPSGVPPEAMAELERLRRRSAQRNLRMTGQLVRILELFERYGIEALPIKGPVLAQDLYGDPTVRMSCDLDILVRHRDAAAARRLLLVNGFEDEGSFNEHLLRRAGHRIGEVHLRRRGGEPMVDLHWRLTVDFSVREISADRLLAAARTIRVLEREVRAPGEADQLLITALNGSRDEWRRLELRLAVALQVARLPDEAWPELCAAARELGCLRRLLVGVAHACRPFPVAVPAEVLRGLARDRLRALPARRGSRRRRPPWLARSSGDAVVVCPQRGPLAGRSRSSGHAQPAPRPRGLGGRAAARVARVALLAAAAGAPACQVCAHGGPRALTTSASFLRRLRPQRNDSATHIPHPAAPLTRIGLPEREGTRSAQKSVAASRAQQRISAAGQACCPCCRDR